MRCSVIVRTATVMIGLCATFSAMAAAADSWQQAVDCPLPATRPALWWESVAGPLDTQCWTPLSLSDFFTDGWDRPYDSIDYPVPRQTWINNADGAFYRLVVFSGTWAQGTSEVVDTSNGSLFLFTPLNRRFEIGWFLPFALIAPDPTAPAVSSTTGTGDLTIAPRFLLAEQKEYTVTANCYVRCPTGEVSTGNGVASLSPDLEFWANPFSTWVLRGAIGCTVPTNLTSSSIPLLEENPWTGFNLTPGPFSSLDARLATGVYLTGADAPYFKDLCFTLATNFHTRLSGGNTSYFSMTPGFRFGIGHEWYLLGGFEVPTIGPLPFRNQAICQAIKNF